MATARLTHFNRAHHSFLRRRPIYLLAWLATFIVLCAVSSLFAALPTASAAPTPFKIFWKGTLPAERHVFEPEYNPIPKVYHHSLSTEADAAIATNGIGGDNVSGSEIDSLKETTENANSPAEMNSNHHAKSTGVARLTDSIPIIRNDIGMIIPTTPPSPSPSPSGLTQTQTPTLPFPDSLWDKPGHAIASGLFVGVVGTCLLWLVGFMVRIYVGWVWRGLVGVRGEGRARRDLSHKGGVGRGDRGSREFV